MESLKNIEVDSVADLAVPVDVNVPSAAEVEVAQQAPGPVVGTGVESIGAEARDPGVDSARCRGLHQGDVAGAGESYEYVTGDGQVAESFESQGEPQLGLWWKLAPLLASGERERTCCCSSCRISVHRYTGASARRGTCIDPDRMSEWALRPFEFPHAPLPRAEHPSTPGRH